MKTNWILLTAGFFPQDMVAAAERVEKQAKKIYPVIRVIRLSRENVQEFCPKLTSKYPDKLSITTPGFGYAAWKAEAVYSALNGDYGPCDGVVWVDAGCEINSSIINNLKFKKMLKRTISQGHFAFALNTPEAMYTKKKVWDLFPGAVGVDPGIQYQATYFMLYGRKGKNLSESIFLPIYENFEIVDPTILGANESEELELAKCEQSLLSLAIKSQRWVPAMKLPPAGNRGLKSQLRGIFQPVWIARNRKGESIIPKWIQHIP